MKQEMLFFQEGEYVQLPCRVRDPIPITPMHEIPEVSEPILPRLSERTKHTSILLRDYVCE